MVKEKNHITSWGSDNEDDEMVYGLKDFDTEIYDKEEHIAELYGHEEHDRDNTEDRLEDLNMENEEIDVNNGEKPYVGMKFEYDDDAYVFYNRYAKTMGFGVRKGVVRRSKKDGCVIGCRFFCSKEGFREERYKKNTAIKKRRRGETRVGCGAITYVNKTDEGMWAVSLFEENHNHKCETPKKCHLFPSHRRIDENQGAMIEKMNEAGIRKKFNDALSL